MSRVYRFHRPAEDACDPSPWLLRKRKGDKAQGVHLLAADELTLTDVNGTRPIDTYQDVPGTSTVTLTRREAELIALANPGLRPPQALEEMHPWLPRRAFVPDSTQGYRSLLEVYNRYAAHLIHAATYCDRAWNTICNALRRKTALDYRFYSAWHLPIQEVFVLQENRPERGVIALDVNSMYSACLQEDIPHPAALRHVDIGRDYLPGEQLATGLYRCRLTNPTTAFIRSHNPFTTFFCGRRLRAPLTEAIEVELNEFEIRYFCRHFGRIHLIDAVTADKAVPHPLAREARRAFSRRMSFRGHGNKPLADREKYLATLLASCGSRPSRVKTTFRERDDAMRYLDHAYGIAAPADEPDVATDAWISRHKTLSMVQRPGEVSVAGLDRDDRSTCFMLGQRVVAKGRVSVLELMERALALCPDVQLCYVNIDSVHFSLPTAAMQDVLATLHEEASDSMGGFKIESVTKHGLWLEPGRYWLYSDQVEKFRNRGISDATRPFRDRSSHVLSRQIGDLHIPIRAMIRMDKSMSHLRALRRDPDGLTRLQLIEHPAEQTFSHALDALEANRKASTPFRLKAFSDLKRRMEQTCSATSEQVHDQT